MSATYLDMAVIKSVITFRVWSSNKQNNHQRLLLTNFNTLLYTVLQMMMNSKGDEKTKTKIKELTPYRPNEWDITTFQQKIQNEKFAQYAYEAHSVDQQVVKMNELFTTTISKIPNAIKRLNIWGGADEYNHGGDCGSSNPSGSGGSGGDGGSSLTLLNVFQNEEMFKSVIRAVQISEIVGYEECLSRLTLLGTYLNEIGHYDEPDITKKTEEGFLIEVAIQLYYQAVYVTDVHERNQTKLEQEFEAQQYASNKLAFQQILRHMPKNIHEISSEKELIELPCPNHETLPKNIARRFFRKNILQLLRTPITPASTFLDRVHPIWFEDKFVSNGLTLTEHRALQYYLKGLKQMYRNRLTFTGGGGDDDNNNSEQTIYKRKYQWLQSLENNYKDSLAKHEKQQKEDNPKKKEAIDYCGDYGWYDDPNDDDDDANNATAESKKLLLDDLGYNDINSKMMKNWLEKKSSSSTTEEEPTSRPPPPMMMMMISDLKKNKQQHNNLLIGIQQQKAGEK